MEKITIDISKFSYDDLEQIEEWAEHPILKEFETKDFRVKTIKAFFCWFLRQNDPKMTIKTLPTFAEMPEFEIIGEMGPLAPNRAARRHPSTRKSSVS